LAWAPKYPCGFLAFYIEKYLPNLNQQNFTNAFSLPIANLPGSVVRIET
jgi:hypothetical protein